MIERTIRIAQAMLHIASPRARSLRLSALVVVLIALFVIACSGGQEGGQLQLLPQIVSSDLAVGPNRFSLGLLTVDKEPVLGAQVRARFFQIVGEQQMVRGEADLQPVNVTLSYTESHPGIPSHTHEVGQVSVYKANVSFDQPGPWAVEIVATLDGETLAPVTAGFDVRRESLSPSIGDPAPRSRQTILTEVADITEIDTSDPPNPDMHTMTIAEAVTSGRPTLVAFATPAFCLSLICGPAKQTVDQLYPRYKDQVNFIHVEPYFLDSARSGEGLFPVPVVTEWSLQTEPWLFIIDDEGNVAAKFEAVVAESELEAALQQVLAEPGELAY